MVCFRYHISIYKFGLSVCLSVCLYPINVKTAELFCVTSRDHREGLWMIKISNIFLLQNLIFIKFLKIMKFHEIFCETPRIIFVLFYDVHKENMFTISLRLVNINFYKKKLHSYILTFYKSNKVEHFSSDC